MKSTFAKLDTSLTATLINARNETTPEVTLLPGAQVHAAERIGKCISFRGSADGHQFDWMYAPVEQFIAAAPSATVAEDSHLARLSQSSAS